MYIQTVFDLTLVADSETFSKLLKRAKSNGYCKQHRYDDKKIVDSALTSKGIIVAYRDSQYKKKIKLTVNPDLVLGGDEPNSDNSLELVRKLERRIGKYFDSKYKLDDFKLSQISLTTDINVGERVSDYLKILHNIGKVKFFSPLKVGNSDENRKGGGFGLKGNSNGVEFRAYRPKHDKDVLRVEIRLTKKETIRAYCVGYNASDHIQAMAENVEHIFMDTFQYIVPRGNFYKKPKAEKLIWENVTETKFRYRMLHLLKQIPEKKSLHLAQKTLSFRNMDKIMAKFAEINVSPVTISKRHDVSKLDSLYKFM